MITTTTKSEEELIAGQEEIFRLARRLSRPGGHVSKRELRQLLIHVADQLEALGEVREELERLRSAEPQPVGELVGA